jgi:hypothetical protein
MIPLVNHPAFKRLTRILRKPENQGARFPDESEFSDTLKKRFFHTTDQLHEKPEQDEVENGCSSKAETTNRDG